MHMVFGNLAKIRGIVYYRLSPHEQKTFAGIIDHGVPNMIRRFNESVLKVCPRKYRTLASSSSRSKEVTE
jgi:ubiquinol-cytochrome c reductase subunit 8